MHTEITLLIECADENDNIPNQAFGIDDCSIYAKYQEDGTTISLRASGFAGEFSNGDIIDAQPSVQFDEFCRVYFDTFNGNLAKSFNLDEIQAKFDELAQEYPNNTSEIDALGAKISKMANTLYNLAGNAKLLNKHPREVRQPMPF